MSDDDDSGTVLHLPPRPGNSDSGVPSAPDAGSLFAPPRSESEETPDGERGEIRDSGEPHGGAYVPSLRDPESFLQESGIPAPPDEYEADGEYESDGEYEQPRSLADRLGDWLELRLDIRRARLDAEAPYREAEIARKVSLLESKTASETGLMDAQNKLRQAHLKARGDKASARGKGTGSGSGAGFGSDKGGRTKSGGPSGGGRGSRGGSGSHGSSSSRHGAGGAPRGPGQQRSGQRNGSPGNTSGGRDSRTPAKAPGRASGGRAGGGGPKAPGGSRNGPGGGSGGSGRGGNQPKAPGSSSTTNRSPRTPTRTLDPHKPGNRPWKDGGRGGSGKLPGTGGGTGPWKDKPVNKPARSNGKTSGGSSGAWPVNKTPTPPKKTIDPHKPGSRPWKDDPRPGPKATGPASKPAGADAKSSGGPKPTAPTGKGGGAGRVIDPHKPGERPWKPPVKGAEVNRDKTPGAKSTPDSATEGGAAKVTPTKDKPRPKVILTKDRAKKAPTGDEAHDKTGKSRARRSKKDKKARPGNESVSDYERFQDRAWEAWEERTRQAYEQYDGDWSDDSINAYLDRLWSLYGDSKPGSEPWRFFQKTRKRFEEILERRRREREQSKAEARARRGEGTVTAESVGITVERDAPPSSPGAEADNSPQPAQGHRPAGLTRGVQGLPPAPTPHTQRPGTTRPDSPDSKKEEPMAGTQVAPPGRQGALAAQHQTDITFEEYLQEIASIAVTAGMDKERAEDLAAALAKVADALREMADDLTGDHNISEKVTTLITDLADSAERMKTQAERCANECDTAFEAAKLAAQGVARVYGEDMDAVKENGLAHGSAAAHHD